ncbi:DUF3068 domain-containing protein [Streptomyces sp. NPDC046931]|uniref:DUF3068 domain-containing protein n=1 Tax=Streptomyces sp. NPDC046931 TaxID=3154806 RepID=UPI0033F3DD43
MRRKAGLILLAFAVFLTALSPLLRWYVFPRVAKVPANQYQTMVLQAKNATLLDYSTMTSHTVPEVTVVQTLKGNVEAAREAGKTAGRDVVVWDGLSYVRGPGGEMVARVPERYVFDAHSQEPVHVAGESVDGDPVRRDGIEFKWPFLTQKRDYRYFDAQARVTAPIHYKGARNFRGLTVYYFEQTIPWTKVPYPRVLPVKGLTREWVAKTGTTRWYTTVRRFWVEPVTGAPVYGEEIHREELRGGALLGGRAKVTAFAGHVKMREDYIRSTVALVKHNRLPILLLTSYLPWGFLVLGVCLLALSLCLEARGRRPDGPAPAEPAEPEPVTA